MLLPEENESVISIKDDKTSGAGSETPHLTSGLELIGRGSGS